MYLLFLHLLLLPILNSESKTPKDFIWENRILIIKAHELENPWFKEEITKKLQERKLLVFYFNDETLHQTNSKDSIDKAAFLKKLNPEKVGDIQWVLIGLDGGIKSSGFKIPETEEIFRIIDAMPMRQSEIRSGGK